MLRTRVFALRVLERRETNITRPNSRRNFKQMRNGGNRCIDLTDLRQNFCAIRFRDWHNIGPRYRLQIAWPASAYLVVRCQHSEREE